VPLKKDDLKVELRSRLGDPSVAELPDAQVEHALDAALREFSRFRPSQEFVQLSLAARGTTYPLPAGVTGVSDLWMMPIGSGVLDPLQFKLALASYEVETLYALGAYAADDLALAWEVEQRQGTDGSELPPVLTLFPPPAFDAVAFMRAERTRTWENVGPQEKEALLTYARGEALEYIGRKRSRSVNKIPTAAGTLSLNTGYNDRADGRQFKKDFYAMMGGGATVALG